MASTKAPSSRAPKKCRSENLFTTSKTMVVKFMLPPSLLTGLFDYWACIEAPLSSGPSP